MPGRVELLLKQSESRASRTCHADFGLPSNGLQGIDFKAEVVELADTPS
jgi:hypothetical protein